MRGFSRPGDLGLLTGDLVTSGLDFGDLVFFQIFVTWRPDPFFYVFFLRLATSGLNYLRPGDLGGPPRITLRPYSVFRYPHFW